MYSREARNEKNRRVLTLLSLLFALTLTVSAHGNDSASPTAEQEAQGTMIPLVALHYQDILAHEPPQIDLLIPPPNIVDWEFATYHSSSDCLKGDGILTGPPGTALILRFDVLNEGSCVSIVSLEFGRDNESWEAQAVVIANRLPNHPPLQGAVTRTSSGQLPLPNRQPLARNAQTLLLKLTNDRPAPMRLLGIGDNLAFAKHIGDAFRYEPSNFNGLYEDLYTDAEPFGEAVLQEGEGVDVALVLDPRRQITDGAGTVTVRPVAIIEISNQLHTVEFPLVSTAWGTALP